MEGYVAKAWKTCTTRYSQRENVACRDAGSTRDQVTSAVEGPSSLSPLAGLESQPELDTVVDSIEQEIEQEIEQDPPT